MGAPFGRKYTLLREGRNIVFVSSLQMEAPFDKSRFLFAEGVQHLEVFSFFVGWSSISREFLKYFLRGAKSRCISFFVGWTPFGRYLYSFPGPGNNI